VYGLKQKLTGKEINIQKEARKQYIRVLPPPYDYKDI
jgi:hypothetical protein